MSFKIIYDTKKLAILVQSHNLLNSDGEIESKALIPILKKCRKRLEI